MSLIRYIPYTVTFSLLYFIPFHISIFYWTLLHFVSNNINLLYSILLSLWLLSYPYKFDWKLKYTQLCSNSNLRYLLPYKVYSPYVTSIPVRLRAHQINTNPHHNVSTPFNSNVRAIEIGLLAKLIIRNRYCYCPFYSIATIFSPF